MKTNKALRDQVRGFIPNKNPAAFVKGITRGNVLDLIDDADLAEALYADSIKLSRRFLNVVVKARRLLDALAAHKAEGPLLDRRSDLRTAIEGIDTEALDP